MELEKSLIYGPVWSRRFGWDLGVNLLPLEYKLCTFDCIYCQYGFTPSFRNERYEFPDAELVISEWGDQLRRCSELKIDVHHTTFSGNGEPTMNPAFAKIVKRSVEWRNHYAPNVRLAVLSNGYRLREPSIREAMECIDEAVVKLDSAIPQKLQQINHPLIPFDLGRFLDGLKSCRNLVIQTMFVRGWNDGPEDLRQWRKALHYVHPRSVQIYTVSRDTAVPNLLPISRRALFQIARESTQMLKLPVKALCLKSAKSADLALNLTNCQSLSQAYRSKGHGIPLAQMMTK